MRDTKQKKTPRRAPQTQCAKSAIQLHIHSDLRKCTVPTLRGAINPCDLCCFVFAVCFAVCWCVFCARIPSALRLRKAYTERPLALCLSISIASCLALCLSVSCVFDGVMDGVVPDAFRLCRVFRRKPIPCSHEGLAART